jgi:hypothetical protein
VRHGNLIFGLLENNKSFIALSNLEIEGFFQIEAHYLALLFSKLRVPQVSVVIQIGKKFD